ncbi:hypothetical protein XarbCFBP8132_10740 [Xanthomonas arboricola]|uniref:RHS repeat-associated core domain-containing protein n=1 Tax=Xanthomonas arboricola TaxID=56448 RepID=UPI000CEE51D5|nr:RHS repeat-associated core domain-containing protein [Xanthomonas arboricola]PPT41588.1 hypothetical protein XarbCFBP8132_10740 [Xanthomonas arboricola]
MNNRHIYRVYVLKNTFLIWLFTIYSVAEVQAQTIRYIHTDGLGSIVLVTDQNKSVVERREYEPYGSLLGAVVDGPSYTGHVADSSTGLYYMQQRYYDPAIGRFISVDPVSTDVGTGFNFNRYWYGNNSPYAYIDPDGRATVAIGRSGSAIAIGGVTYSDQWAFSFPSGDPSTWRLGRLIQAGGQAGTNIDVGANYVFSYSEANSAEEMAGTGLEASVGGALNIGEVLELSVGYDSTVCSGCKKTQTLSVGPKLGLLPAEVHASITRGFGVTLIGRSPFRTPTVTVGAPVPITGPVDMPSRVPSVTVGSPQPERPGK